MSYSTSVHFKFSKVYEMKIIKIIIFFHKKNNFEINKLFKFKK